eukprot:scaffold25335_cov109-Skeletonema_dohrnii-CCMP3373.AAC.2
MSKISSYDDVFNKGDGDVISGVYNVTFKAGVGAASHGGTQSDHGCFEGLLGAASSTSVSV